MPKAQNNGFFLPSEDEARSAREAVRRLEEKKLHRGPFLEVSIPEATLGLFQQMLTEIGKGHGVRALTIETGLSTQEAADILQVSRPFLIKLLDQKKIPFTLVGSHRRLKAEDVYSYRAKSDQRFGTSQMS